jgi:hypothetical protein
MSSDSSVDNKIEDSFFLSDGDREIKKTPLEYQRDYYMDGLVSTGK